VTVIWVSIFRQQHGRCEAGGDVSFHGSVSGLLSMKEEVKRKGHSVCVRLWVRT
jgi:hypothetical protein